MAEQQHVAGVECPLHASMQRKGEPFRVVRCLHLDGLSLALLAFDDGELEIVKRRDHGDGGNPAAIFSLVGDVDVLWDSLTRALHFTAQQETQG